MKIKATCFWEDDNSLYEKIKRYAFDKDHWKDIQFVTHNDYDKLVILNYPHETMHNYNPQHAITLLTEPPGSHHIKPHPTSGILPMYLPLPGWTDFIDGAANSITTGNNEKKELLSIVTSDLASLEGHRIRLELIYYLDQIISEGLDTWGRSFNNNFFSLIKSYMGSIPHKYNALWNYKYHVACENTFMNNYFTEKIVDPIIAECCCFYDGCNNLEQFIDERAFIRINAADPATAVENIIHAIENDHWESSISYIKKQKQRLLYDLNPLNIIWLAIHEKDVLQACKL